MQRRYHHPAILSLGCLLGLVAMLAGTAKAEAHAHYDHSQPSIS